MKNLILGIYLLSTSFAFAQDVVNEKYQGTRTSNGEICILEHRQLDYSFPELFISLHSPESESLPFPDAHLLEAMGLDLQTYQAIMYGDATLSAEASKGVYSYKIDASSSNSGRTISIKGLSIPDGNRASIAKIVLQGKQIESVSISKQARTIFGGWKTVFQDTCQSMSKVN